MPGPSRRHAQSGGPSNRRAGAHRQRRTGQASSTRRLARRVSWSRRLGVAAAFLLLVGGSVAFAGGALGPALNPGSPAERSASPVPALGAPRLDEPLAAITRQASVDVSGSVGRPADGARRGYRLRVYINGAPRSERGLPRDGRFTIAGVPLDRGENQISAALVDGEREGPRSASISVVRDDVAPAIHVTRPAGGTTVYGARETLRGRTEAGATVTARDESGRAVEVVTAADGRFEANLELAPGENKLLLRSVDGAGNVARTRLLLLRAESRAAISLALSPTTIELAELPMALEIVATVRDENGQSADGAQVTFSVSPPSQPTMTLRTVATGGLAIWDAVRIDDDGRASGAWLVTVLAELPSGLVLREDATVSVQ